MTVHDATGRSTLLLSALSCALSAALHKAGIEGSKQMQVWNSQTVPHDGAIVYVLSVDEIGRYELPFPVLFKDDKWLNASTRQELEAFVAAWRPATSVDARRAFEKRAE